MHYSASRGKKKKAQHVTIGVIWGWSLQVVSNVRWEHTTSYSHLIETVYLHLYSFPDIASYLSKVGNFSYSTCIWRPHWGWPHSNFTKTFGIWKLEFPALVFGVLCVILSLDISTELQLLTNRRIDGMRDGHSTYCTSIASSGKKTNLKFDSVEYYSIWREKRLVRDPQNLDSGNCCVWAVDFKVPTRNFTIKSNMPI